MREGHHHAGRGKSTPSQFHCVINWHRSCNVRFNSIRQPGTVTAERAGSSVLGNT
jgi:hypothetical protein